MSIETSPPGIVGVRIAFNAEEVESFFVARSPRSRATQVARIRTRTFSEALYRRALRERIIRLLLDRYHGALALRLREVKALYQSVAIRGFSLRRKPGEERGTYTVLVIYQVAGESDVWVQTLLFERSDLTVTGGVQGTLTTTGRFLDGD